ncbi:MAG: DUF3667 domain-containing protein [Bacteroidetes bacterium]|nr:MAG: DUF3667 domain-containing protein [Bacteroidota bacterium]TAF95529.1 MAG: DUF3667 domain-containing protein [Bacteroidota bacterium]
MSKHKHRSEPICLNCNAVTYGKFCHVCGQENLEPKESFLHLSQHFLYDITHFDGKFFNTTKYLLFKPGFLSYEYNRGRRASYLNPIKMFVFVSAFFFFFVFTLFNKSEEARRPPKARVMVNGDTVYSGSYLSGTKFKSLEEYQGYKDSLPANKRPGWYDDRREISKIKRRQASGQDAQYADEALIDRVSHALPQMMFFLLPIVALILFWLYRKIVHYYAHHLIFTVHLFTGFYILLFVNGLFIWLSEQNKAIHWVHYVADLAGLYLVIFSALSFKRFYQQPLWKTIIKLTMAFFLSLFLFVLVFAAVMFYNLIA